jgi:hypothetical protein
MKMCCPANALDCDPYCRAVTSEKADIFPIDLSHSYVMVNKLDAGNHVSVFQGDFYVTTTAADRG